MAWDLLVISFIQGPTVKFKTVFDSGFYAVDSGFRVLDSGFQS